MRVAVKSLGGTGLGAPLGTGKPKSTAGGVQSVPSSMMKDEPGVFFKLADLLTASLNTQRAGEMSIYGGKKVDAIADLLDTKAEQMITPAKPEVSYVAERGAVGAAEGIEGMLNSFSYMGQGLNRTLDLQASQDVAMWGAITGNKVQTAHAQHMEQTALDSARVGLQDAVSFGDNYNVKVEQKYANTYISDSGRKAAMVAEGLGGLLPTTAASIAAPGSIIPTAMMFLSSMGNATQQAKKAGYNDLQAAAYGTAVGAVEVGTEKMFDGMAGLFGKGALDDVVQSGIQKTLKNDTAQKVVNAIVNALGEGAEEFVAEFGTRLVNELTIDSDDRTLKQTFDDAWDSARTGAIISGITQAGGNIAGSIRGVPGTWPYGTIGAVSVKDGSMPFDRAGQKTAPKVGAEYRAAQPQNVEYPTVPIINLSMQSVTDLNNGVLPDVGNSLRSAAIARARTRLGLDENSAVYIPASNVLRNGEEYVLKITKASLNKMLSPADGEVIPVESIVVLDNIERIANNGVYFRSEGDRQGRDQIAGYDHLMTTIYIDNQPYSVDMRVRVYDKKSGGENRLYYFTPEELVTLKKVDTSPPTGERRAFTIPSEGVSTSIINIAQNPGAVKYNPKHAGVAPLDYHTKGVPLWEDGLPPFAWTDDLDWSDWFEPDPAKEFEEFWKNYLETADMPQYNTDIKDIGLQYFANKSILKQNENQLKKSVASWTANVALHKEKIANPEMYDLDWDDKTAMQKEGLIRHWEKEVRNFEKNIADANDELMRRGCGTWTTGKN